MKQGYTSVSIAGVNTLYLLCMLLFIIGGEIIYRINPSLSYNQKMVLLTATQIAFIFIPTALFIYYKKINIKHTLRLNKVSFINILISSGIILFAIPITAFLNFIVVILLKYLGKLHPPPYFQSETISQLIINLLVVALVPALFEETLFRGIIMRGYEKIGKVGAILVSSLLFALLHRDLQTLIGTFLLGLVIAYVVYKTNSIYAGVAAHFTNNGFVVLMTFLLPKLQQLIQDYSPHIAEQIKNESQNPNLHISMEQMILSFVALGVIAGFFSVIFIALILLLNYTTRNVNRESDIIDQDATQPENLSNITENYNEGSIANTYQNNANKYEYLPLIFSIGLVLYSYFRQLI